MELTSPELIGSLMADHRSGNLVRHPRGASPSKRPVPRRRCTCGRCRECVENARWERIFEEKFADPTYYTRTVLRTDSCLKSL